MPEAPRDDGFGTTVRRAVARMAPRVDECPSADELAALVDGTLLEPGYAVVVAHLGSCARCQRVVALAMETGPATAEEGQASAPGAPSEGAAVVAFPQHRGRRMWRWVVPVAAATAAVLAWVVVRPIEYRRHRRAPMEVALGTRESPPMAAADGGPSAPAAATTPGRAGSSGTSGAPSTQSAARGAVGRDDGTRLEAVARRDSKASSSPAADEVPPQAPAALAPQSALAASPVEAGEARRQVATLSDATTPGATSAGAAREEVETATRSRARSASGNLPASPPVGAERAAAESTQTRTPSAVTSGATEPTSPLAPTGGAASLAEPPIGERSRDQRWRMVPGAFEFSADQGRSWTSVPVPGPVDVVAAEVASTGVWWLADRRGNAVLRVERRSVERHPVPSDGAIAGLEVIDETRVFVRMDTGARYATEDGGRTWRRLP